MSSRASRASISAVVAVALAAGDAVGGKADLAYRGDLPGAVSCGRGGAAHSTSRYAHAFWRGLHERLDSDRSITRKAGDSANVRSFPGSDLRYVAPEDCPARHSLYYRLLKRLGEK